MAQSTLLIRLRKTIARTKDPVKKARLQKQLDILTKKTAVGKAKAGDPGLSYSKLKSAIGLGKSEKPRHPLAKLGGNLSSYSYQKPDYTAISKEAAGDVDPSYFNYADPFGDIDVNMEDGGSIKKAKKKSKKPRRACLRGGRSESRGS